jgi:tRNA (guanine9-N1)-methyltransferase
MAPQTNSSVPGSTAQLQDAPLSKNALKRALKRKRWEETKDSRKALKKAKLKDKKEKMKLAGQPSKRRKVVVEGQVESGIKVVLDCSFDDLMTDKVFLLGVDPYAKEITSMSSQLTRCHAENRRSLKTVELFITSLTGQLGERMETNLKGVHHHWKGVYVSTETYDAVLGDIPPDNFIYLTADSNHVIEALENDKVYIIGGLVDKNRHKAFHIMGYSDNRACAMIKQSDKTLGMGDCQLKIISRWRVDMF